MRLWRFSHKHAESYARLTGSLAGFSPDDSERSMLGSDLQKLVTERPLVRTLLANAGNARMFWLLSH
jgi:hypothetical protein